MTRDQGSEQAERGDTPESPDDQGTFRAKSYRGLNAAHSTPKPPGGVSVPTVIAPAPVLSQVVPPSVAVLGGATICVSGENFSPDCTVRIGSTKLEVERVSWSELRAVVPAHPPGAVTLRVDNPDGQAAEMSGALEFDEGPVVLQLNPPRASLHGGTEITVTGKNFRPGCTVSLLDQHSPEVSFDGPEQLRFVAPRHDTTESGPVHVTNPNGLRSDGGASLFYVSPKPPTVTTIDDPSGSTAGGKRVVISGENFQAGCVVRFGELRAEVVRGDETAVEVSVPAATEPGTVSVVIENPDGQTAALAAAFAYELPPAPPKIISVEPNQGWCAGGTIISVAGDNFDELTVLRVGEVQCIIDRRTRTEIVATTPPHEVPEVVAVEVVNRERVPVRLERSFTYAQRPTPAIEDIAPVSGPTTGGTRVTIEGSHLGSDVSVRIGRQRAKLLRALGTTALEIVTPPQRSPGLMDVQVIGPDESTALRPKAFKYEAAPAPSISSIAPNSCGTSGGSELTIGGKGFVATTEVLLGRKAIETVKVVDGETLEIKVPPGKHGTMVDVTVRNPDGKQAVTRRAFQYDERYD